MIYRSANNIVRLATFFIYTFQTLYVFWISNLDVVSSMNKMCFFRGFHTSFPFSFPGWENWHVERSTAIPDYHNTGCQACMSLPASAWHPSLFHLTCFKASLSSAKKSRTKRISPNITHYTFSLKKILSRLRSEFIDRNFYLPLI